jgi:hypothetical protein
MEDSKLSNEDILEVVELQELIHKTQKIIFDKVQELVESKKFNLAKSYVRALAIDMIGNALFFPRIDKNEEAKYLSKWVKHRYKINLKMSVKD